MIEEAVQQILQGQNGLSYEIQGKKIIIKKVQSGTATPVKKIKATVGSMGNPEQPLLGATVKAGGTPKCGRFARNFSLNVACRMPVWKGRTSVIKAGEVKAQDGKCWVFTLQEDTEMLYIVVAQGYGPR